jgi:hypothetical protein
MYVVFDSAVLIADYMLRSIHMQALLEQSRNGPYRVAIPEVVFLEVANKWRMHAAPFLERTETQAHRLGLEDVRASLPDLEQAADHYRAWLRDRLNEYEVYWLDVPNVDHKILLRNAVERRKPFSDNGSGYRDALIWESVKILARDSSAQVYFISHDKSDFAKDGQLHPELTSDLQESGIKQEGVAFVEGCKKAVEILMTPANEILESFKTRLDYDTDYRDHVISYIVEHLDTSLQVTDQSLRRGETVRVIESVQLPIDSYKPLNAWVIGKDRVGVELEVKANIDVIVEVDVSRYTDSIVTAEQSLPGTPALQSETKAVKGVIMVQLILSRYEGSEICDGYAQITSLSETGKENSRMFIQSSD